MPNPRLCRRIKANLIWLAKDLELGLSPLELETLGIYCATRATWLGRWAA